MYHRSSLSLNISLNRCTRELAKRSTRFLAVILLLTLTGHNAAALEQSDDIDTNRPSFMNSPLVVPKGSLQLENGTLYQHFQHGQTTFDIPETEVRVGLLKNTEFQMFTPNYFLFHQQSSDRTDTPSANRAGVSDIQEAGLKIQLPTIIKDLTVSVIGGVTVPTGRKLISTGGVQPVVRIPWGKTLTKNWSIMGQQSILLLNSGKDVQWQNFWMLNRSIGKRTSVFAEYGGFYTDHAVWSNIAHFGAVRKLNKNTQVDMQWGVGMNKTAPSAFVGAGYSFRFDRLPLINKL